MVHDTSARKSAWKLETDAQVLIAEALVLAEIAGMERETQARKAQATGLREHAQELKGKARLEDLTERKEPPVKQTKTCERTYYRWVASWRESEDQEAILGQLQEDEPGRSFAEGKGAKGFCSWN
jgi:hypothetical protein